MGFAAAQPQPTRATPLVGLAPVLWRNRWTMASYAAFGFGYFDCFTDVSAVWRAEGRGNADGERSGGAREEASRQGGRVATGRWRAARREGLSRQSASAQARGQGGRALCPLAAPAKRQVGKSSWLKKGGTAQTVSITPKRCPSRRSPTAGRKPMSGSSGFASYARLLQQPTGTAHPISIHPPVGATTGREPSRQQQRD